MPRINCSLHFVIAPVRKQEYRRFPASERLLNYNALCGFLSGHMMDHQILESLCGLRVIRRNNNTFARC